MGEFLRLKNTMKMDKEELYCHYSDLPSPMAYVQDNCMDYDSMGNHGRFPMSQEKKKPIMKRLIQNLLLWWDFRKSKKSKKSIWKL